MFLWFPLGFPMIFPSVVNEFPMRDPPLVRVRRDVEKKRQLRRAETRDYEATEDQELGRCVWGKGDMVNMWFI